MKENPRVHGADERSNLPVPSAVPIWWVGALKSDPTKRARAYERFFFDARVVCMRELKCGPDELTVVLEETKPTGAKPADAVSDANVWDGDTGDIG